MKRVRTEKENVRKKVKHGTERYIRFLHRPPPPSPPPYAFMTGEPKGTQWRQRLAGVARALANIISVKAVYAGCVMLTVQTVYLGQTAETGTDNQWRQRRHKRQMRGREITTPQQKKEKRGMGGTEKERGSNNLGQMSERRGTGKAKHQTKLE